MWIILNKLVLTSKLRNRFCQVSTLTVADFADPLFPTLGSQFLVLDTYSVSHETDVSRNVTIGRPNNNNNDKNEPTRIVEMIDLRDLRQVCWAKGSCYKLEIFLYVFSLYQIELYFLSKLQEVAKLRNGANQERTSFHHCVTCPPAVSHSIHKSIGLSWCLPFRFDINSFKHWDQPEASKP